MDTNGSCRRLAKLRTRAQACRYLVINFGTSKSPKFTRQRDKYACGALAVLVLLNYNPLYGDHNLRSPMTDAFSYALYFACGKTSGSKATRDYRPRSATFLGLQRWIAPDAGGVRCNLPTTRIDYTKYQTPPI